MIIVRNCFVAKPGMASKLATLLKETANAVEMPKHKILTDLTGEFNRVILEYEVDDLSGFEARLREYGTNEVLREKMKGYTDLWLTGSRELLKVW